MINEINKNISKKCDLCGSAIMIDEYALGHCEDCGWANVEIAIEKPNRVFLPNFVSFNRAKQLYEKSMSLKPSFDEFIEILDADYQMAFSQKGKTFEVAKVGDGVEFYNKETDYAASYDSICEFKEYAEIDGKQLNAIWGEIEKIARLY